MKEKIVLIAGGGHCHSIKNDFIKDKNNETNKFFP